MAIAGCFSCANSCYTIKVSFQTFSAQKPCTVYGPNSRLQFWKLYVADSNPSAKPNSIIPGEYVGFNIPKQRKLFKEKCKASSFTIPAVEVIDCSLPSWAEFELGRAPIFWKTMSGLPPTSGESLTLFYNPSAKSLTPNKEFGIAFNGGFNQPIMCGGKPRVMVCKERGEADLPIFSIKIRAPKHAISLIFSFTNGVEWDGPYNLQFQVLKKWRNKPISFFNEGLAEELSREGACEGAIFPDSHVIIESCEINNLYFEGGDRCRLDVAPGCMDPNSPLFDPLANVDDGSCPIESDAEEE